jgi:hypothetical protein
MKELWIQAHEDFVEEHGVDPTDDQMDIAYRDAIDRIVDHADMLRKAEKENLR